MYKTISGFFESVILRNQPLKFLHTLSVHYAHAAANLNSGYSKYAKSSARAFIFLYNCTPNILRSADVMSLSIA